jgi:hypothetical protein
VTLARRALPLSHDCRLTTQVSGHYQIDLIIVLPSLLDFTHFVTSYGNSLLVLSAILRRMSSALVLQQHQLLFRQTPFIGLGPIEIRLCGDPVALCAWTGLSLTAWQEVGEFECELDVWRWMGNVGPGTPFARALRSMARPREVVWREKRKGKPGAMDAYLAYLRSRESPYHIPDAETLPAFEPYPILEMGQVEPDRPVALLWHAADALRYWEKEEVYEGLLEVKQREAREVRERQEGRARRREEQRMADLAAEERRRVEELMGAVRLDEVGDGRDRGGGEGGMVIGGEGDGMGNRDGQVGKGEIPGDSTAQGRASGTPEHRQVDLSLQLKH